MKEGQAEMLAASAYARTHARFAADPEYLALKSAAVAEEINTPGCCLARNRFAVFMEIHTPLRAHAEMLDNKRHMAVESGADASKRARELEASLARAKAEAWEVGHQAGYEEAAFDLRGSPSDADAHTFPRINPYRQQEQA